MDRTRTNQHLSLPLPNIELALEDKCILVLPPTGAGPPFDLPPVPLSLVESVQRLQDVF